MMCLHLDCCTIRANARAEAPHNPALSDCYKQDPYRIVNMMGVPVDEPTAGKAYISSAGWCAPSEAFMPEVSVQRGSVQWDLDAVEDEPTRLDRFHHFLKRAVTTLTGLLALVFIYVASWKLHHGNADGAGIYLILAYMVIDDHDKMPAGLIRTWARKRGRY